ncbi:MAG: hypothetical protein ACRCY4_07765 [Brevinema sp.]
MKNIIIFSFLLLSSCGIQAPQAIPRLFPPGAVTAVYSTAGTGAYTITFEGLNPETIFSGYNLYYTTNQPSAVIGVGTKLVLNGQTSTDPSIQINAPFFTVSRFEVILNNNNASTSNNIFHSGVPAANPSTIYWFIRAYSRSENRESPYSLPVLTVVDP